MYQRDGTLFHFLVLVLDALDEFVVAPADVQVLVVFELHLDLPLHLGQVPRVLCSLYLLASQLLGEPVDLALQFEVLLVQVLRRVEAVLTDLDGVVAMGSDVGARGGQSFGRSQGGDGLGVESLDSLPLLAFLDGHFEEVSGT